MSGEYPMMSKSPEKSYSITLEDKDYGHRTREEILMEIGAATKASLHKQLEQILYPEESIN